jgi:DinB superfamily
MPFNLSEATQILRGTPSTLQTMVGGMPENWVRATEGGSTWSCYDIVGHLIHGELTDWMPRARIILTHGESRAFTPFDRVAQFREDQTRPMSALLDEFVFLRAENLKALCDFRLTSSDLSRRGLHPELGAVTMEQLLAAWVVHDQSHLAQIARVTAKQYTQEVGPWRAYMSVLKS